MSNKHITAEQLRDFHDNVTFLKGMVELSNELAPYYSGQSRQVSMNVVIEQWKTTVTLLEEMNIDIPELPELVATVNVNTGFARDVQTLMVVASEFGLTTNLYVKYAIFSQKD